MSVVVTAPRVPLPPVRPGCPRYRQLQAQHEAWVQQFGVPCPAPSAELQADAHQYAIDVWRTVARPHIGERDRWGCSWVANNCEGQLGAELFARHFGTHTDWQVYETKDHGWDVVLWSADTQGWTHIDVKTRQAWLVVPERRDGSLHISATADYLALVARTDATTFVLCGVIPVPQFRAEMFRVDLRGEPSWAVRTSSLEPLYQFRSRLGIR